MFIQTNLCGDGGQKITLRGWQQQFRDLHTLCCCFLVLLFLPSENYQYTVLESLPVRSVVAKIKAADADIGSNAEMDYRIMDSDGLGVFNVTTDEDTQDGVITLLKVAAGRRCSRTQGGSKPP